VMQVTRNVVVLNFFATYCIPCIREIPAYNRLYQKYQGQPAYSGALGTPIPTNLEHPLRVEFV